MEFNMTILLALFVVSFIIIYFIVRSYSKSLIHSAVFNAYLAAITYETLSEKQQYDVSMAAISFLKSIELYSQLSDNDAMTVMLSTELSDIMRYSLYASAMSSLNISPAIKNEKWHVVVNPIKPLVLRDDHTDNVVRHYFKSKHEKVINLSWKKTFK
jgi:Flp pilus assembly protein TadG